MNEPQVIMGLAGLLIPVVVLTVAAIINIVNMDRKDKDRK